MAGNWACLLTTAANMGCVASAEEEKPTVVASLAEREAQARANRKVAKSMVHNLVHEEFGR